MSRLIAIFAVVLGLFGTVDAGDRNNGSSASNTRASRGPATKSLVRKPSAPVRASRPVERVAYQEAMVDEGVIIEGESEGEMIYEGGGIPQVNMGSCGDACYPAPPPARLVFMFPSNAYVQLDYLMWWQSGMNIPPLLTSAQAGTPANASGILGRSTTTTLLGNEEIFTDARAGGRIKFGWWLANCPEIGLEGEYFRLGGASESFFNQSGGSPILTRPFFNVATGANDSELIAYPGIASGSLNVVADSELQGVAVRLRRRLACGSCSSYSDICGACVPTVSRFEATLGWRSLLLTESVLINEQLQALDDGSRFSIDDNFYTRNMFNGAELGVNWHGRRGLWSLDSLLRLSIGNINQQVTISGGTQITPAAGTAQSFPAGFLTQRSNIGTYERDVFGVVPEFGATLGYQLTPRTRLLAGYTLMFLSNAVRPGDQIDTDLNPNLLPPAQNLNNQVERPQFRFVESDYWVQGLNFGAEFRW